MKQEGPLLEALARRLAECPAEFLAEPRLGLTGSVQVAAVVADLIRDLGGAPLTNEQAAIFQPQSSKRDRNRDRNRLRLVLIACWLLHDSWFCERQNFAAQASLVN